MIPQPELVHATTRLPIKEHLALRDKIALRALEAILAGIFAKDIAEADRGCIAAAVRHETTQALLRDAPTNAYAMADRMLEARAGVVKQ